MKTLWKLVTGSVVAALPLVALAAEAQSAGLPWDGYREWHLVTTEPNTGDPTGFLTNKHAGKKGYRLVYINDVGKPTNLGETPYPYPEGTVVVKETYANEAKFEARKSPELTIMVKLAPGTAPSTGDWEYYMGGSGKKRGFGDSKWGKFCGSCHFNAAGTDFVFMNKKFLDSH